MVLDVIAQSYLDPHYDLQVTLVENGDFLIREISRSEADGPSQEIKLDSNHALVLLDFLLDHRHKLHRLSQKPPTPEPSPLVKWIADQQQQGKLPDTELVSLDGGIMVKDGIIHMAPGDEHRELRERMKLWGAEIPSDNPFD